MPLFNYLQKGRLNMKRCGLLMVVWRVLLGAHGAGQVSSQSLTITYLYDNTAISDGTKPDWGFSCLIQGSGNTLLFDTGAKADIPRANIAALHVDASRINAVVFSHEHADHTGGVEALGKRAGLPTFFRPLSVKRRAPPLSNWGSASCRFQRQQRCFQAS